DVTSLLEEERIAAALIFGEDPLQSPANAKLLSGIDFLLVSDVFLTPTVQEAEVFLPAALPVESEGTYTACDRRVQMVRAAKTPATGMRNADIILALARRMGIPLAPAAPDDIRAEIRQANPAYANLDAGSFWGDGMFATRFPTMDGKAAFSVFDVSIAPFHREKVPSLSSENYFTFHVVRKLNR
ncbi:MAG: molybdopterin-dependent oxidoreductase, partial [Bacteroidota bacterium]|nr:molybdopterin-dependent oxidoreductase [Bacteroidota bacterium]